MSTSAESIFEARLSAFVDAHDAAGLADRLVHRGGDSVDVTWTTHDSPVGKLLLAHARGSLVRVAFEREGFDAVLQTLGERLGPRTLRAAQPSDAVRRQLDEYFTGSRSRFAVATDLRLSGAPFRRAVLSHLDDIPYGATASYAHLAASAGSPRAVRAVGSACATNPLPIVLPCHRVVRSDGSFGNYLGGADSKRFLLDLERAHSHASAR